MTEYVAYYRVSTQRQGQSGLGLEAQIAAVDHYNIVASFREIESGRKCDRPGLEAALALCKERGATLLIAKLDRLARNVHFVTGLLESRVPIVAADMPNADRTFLQMVAVFAEWEAAKISERTKAALKAAKARGVKLGSPNPGRGGAKTAIARRRATEKALIRANPIIEPLHDRGASLREITRALNAANIPAANGGKWHASTVGRAISNKERKVA